MEPPYCLTMHRAARPKILFLIRCLDIGGEQRQLVELATGLHRAGWDILVATFYGGGALEADLHAAGVRLVSLDKRGRWDVTGFLRRLRALLARERPHIAHGSSDAQGALLTLLRIRSFSMHVVWALPSADVDRSRHDWLARLEFRVAAVCSRYAALVISNSEAGRSYHLARGYDADRLVVVPNGVDIERFRPDAAARTRLRAEWAMGGGDTVVGLVARLDPMKDHPNFLRAAAMVSAQRPDVRFVCVGGGTAEYRNELLRMSRQLGLENRLTWAGEREDIWRVYPALDLAVSSSLGEGLPNAVLEAMACGVPCVVTDVGDCVAAVGDTGWSCRACDSEALAQALLTALRALPRDPLHIRQRVSDRYSKHNLVLRTARHFLQLHEKGMAVPSACAEKDAAR